MTITAKFASKCDVCGSTINVGDRIEWVRGLRTVSHTVCPSEKPEGNRYYDANGVEQDADDRSYTAWLAFLAEKPRLTVEHQGVYVLPDGSIVRMQANQTKTAVYPKLWTLIGGSRLTEGNEIVHGEYRYIEDSAERSALRRRVEQTGRKMTMDEAIAFSTRFGICARCTRHLKDAKSVAQGIGPICIKFFSTEIMPEPSSAAQVDDSEDVAEQGMTFPVAQFHNRRSRWTRASDDELEHAAGYAVSSY
jgi:hypothetical protein